MPTVYALLPDTKQTFFESDGTLASGYQLFIYEAGTTTKATTYQESDGVSTNTNPIVLDSRGETGFGVYVEDGTYKLVLATDTDTDPPATPVWTRDNIKPAGLPTVTVGEWTSTTFTYTYISGTEFSLATGDGDQTAEFHVGRRLKIDDTGGTDYGTIEASDYNSTVASATYVKVTLDSGSIDSGLSDVEYSILSADSSTVPHLISDSVGLTLAAESDLTLANDPQTALDAVSLRMLGEDYIHGLTLSNDASDSEHDIDIAAGAAADSTNVYGLVLTGAGLVKQIDATFAAGTAAGGMFTGSVAANTWYHVFVIRLDSDGTIDAGFDTSVTAANIPAGYTYFRRVGSVVTDASSNILAFYQMGDVFYWKSPTLDMDQAVSSTDTAHTLDEASAGVPPGREVEVWCNLYHSGAGIVYLKSGVTGFADVTPSNSAAPLATIEGTGHAYAGPFLTNTSSELKVRSTGTANLRASVICYRDPRI